jgi:stage II sporulation protein M
MSFKKNGFLKELKEGYEDSWSFIRKSSKFIWFGLIAFLFFIFIGFFVPLPEDVFNQLINYFKELVEITKDYGGLEMILFLFFNNLKASFSGMILGVFVGVLPLVYLFSNGFVLGFASKFSVLEGGAISLLRLLPHGIFELPAIILSLGLGLKIGSFALEKKNKWEILKNYLLESLHFSAAA